MNEVAQGADALDNEQADGSGTGDGGLLEQHKQLIDELRMKHDDIAIWAAPPRFGGIIVAAVPGNPKVTQAFINAMNDPKIDKAIAQQDYASKSVVHPDPQTVKDIFAKKPFLPAIIASRVVQLAGSDTQELGKD